MVWPHTGRQGGEDKALPRDRTKVERIAPLLATLEWACTRPDPFFTAKGVATGSGLGLATSLGIVHAHSGLISVETVEGAGSTFRVACRQPEGPGSPAVGLVS